MTPRETLFFLKSKIILNKVNKNFRTLPISQHFYLHIKLLVRKVRKKSTLILGELYTFKC